MVNITFIAHARSVDNEQDITSGQSDPDLSEVGLREASNLQPFIAKGYFDMAFTSDLLRCVHTAEIALEKANMPLIRDKRLREIDYGEYTYKPRNEVRPQRIRFITSPYPQGESYQDLLARYQAFLEALQNDYDSLSVVIFGHAVYPFEVLINKRPIREVLYDVLSEPKEFKLGSVELS